MTQLLASSYPTYARSMPQRLRGCLRPMTVMTYGFPHSVALPTSNVVGAAEYRQATTTALVSKQIASPATAASLSSLARVLRDVGPLQSSGRVMM